MDASPALDPPIYGKGKLFCRIRTPTAGSTRLPISAIGGRNCNFLLGEATADKVEHDPFALG